MKALLRQFGRILPVLFYVLLGVFLVIYIRSIDFEQLRQGYFSWPYLAIASLIAIVSRYWGVYIWLTILKGLGAKNLTGNNSELTHVYAKSWLGRYIPGTAPWILGKIYFASKHGISKNKLAVSSLLEAALQILVTIAVSFILIGFDQRLNVIGSNIKLYMFIASVICVTFLLPVVFNRLIKTVYFLVRRKHIAQRDLATNKVVTVGALLYIAGALLSGLSFFFLAKAVYPQLGYENITFVMGAVNLAGAVSMLAIFVPSGLGVREAMLLLLLSPIMPNEQALLIAIATRLWSVIIDLLFYGLSVANIKFRQNETN